MKIFIFDNIWFLIIMRLQEVGQFLWVLIDLILMFVFYFWVFQILDEGNVGFEVFNQIFDFCGYQLDIYKIEKVWIQYKFKIDIMQSIVMFNIYKIQYGLEYCKFVGFIALLSD